MWRFTEASLKKKKSAKRVGEVSYNAAEPGRNERSEAGGNWVAIEGWQEKEFEG
jgi:hypothetical protein